MVGGSLRWGLEGLYILMDFGAVEDKTFCEPTPVLFYYEATATAQTKES